MQKSEQSMLQQATLQSQTQRKQQMQQQQQHQQQLSNNIIVLRGSRNENGQIVIQNKQDILTFLNEQQQQQQQQQKHEEYDEIKTTVTDAVLTQLPISTTIARKCLPRPQQQQKQELQSNATTLNNNLCLQSRPTATKSRSIDNEDETKETAISPPNTILLQTPINANQLESVLFQTQQGSQIKKPNAERSFVLKGSLRSVSSDGGSNSYDSNKNVPDANKGPFLLQTLKRLEKSQSILVIRNSGAVTSTLSSNNV